ncbi:MAG: pyrroloquinoline quinone precursor peptide PqqA [Pseudomonadota bacterium]
MAWTTPMICELACGMEINMYAPADSEEGTHF